MANETSVGKWTAERVLEALRLSKGEHYERSKAAFGSAWEAVIQAWNDAPIGGERHDWGYHPFTIGSYELAAIADALNRAGPSTPTTAIADGTSQPWTPPADTSAEELRAQRDALMDRVAELEAALGEVIDERDDALVRVGQIEAELAAKAPERAERAEFERHMRWLRGEAPDRRFELVRAAMAAGKDGWMAVREADEAMAAMGKAPAASSRPTSGFLGLFDGKLVASKVDDVAQALLGALVQGNPGMALMAVEEARETLLDLAKWLRGEGGAS